jgi:hypothetical protein
MIVDCMTCPVRGHRCDDCVVTVLRVPGSAGYLVPPERRTSPEVQQRRDLELDAAERNVVSLFVGAGLVNAGALTTLRARRESLQEWGTVRDVG